MGGQGRQEQLALGEVPNIGSRIEGLAAPSMGPPMSSPIE
jgi:hypothetical protein